LSSHLPSSAKVLALLAAANADDATVEQAAQERWTVKQTKQHLGTKQGTRPPRSDAQKALALWESDRLAETERLLSLARTFTAVTDEEVLAEVGLRELPTGKVLRGVTADFHRRPKDVGGWARVPHDAVVDVPATATRTQADLFTEPSPIDEVVSTAEAAARMGIANVHDLSCLLTPSAISKRGHPRRNGWMASPHPKRGMCIVKRAEA
jgi:hypothetical protein